MKLKSVKGAQRHNFDVDYIQNLLEDDSLERNDAVRILGEAIHVVAGLRGELYQLVCEINSVYAQADDARNSQWMKGTK